MNSTLTKDEIEEFLRLIGSINKLNTIASYIHIKNIFEKLSIPFTYVTVPKDKLLLRCRAHTNQEEFFTTKNDLGYRRDELYIKDFGRANEPGQSIFYCSDDRFTAFSETSIITRQDEAVDFEYLTTGV